MDSQYDGQGQRTMAGTLEMLGAEGGDRGRDRNVENQGRALETGSPGRVEGAGALDRGMQFSKQKKLIFWEIRGEEGVEERWDTSPARSKPKESWKQNTPKNAYVR